MQQDFPISTRVALYARVSTEEQKDGQTIDSQVAELVNHAAAKTWEVIGIFKDEGWSGSLLARPELDRLRDEAAAGQFAKVLVNDVDRLARDVTHLGIIKRDLEKNGVDLVFRKLPAEKSPTQNLMVNILGSFAEFEREMIIDRTRRGRRHHIEVRQKMLGCIPSYGYRYVKVGSNTEGQLEIVPEEASVVRNMYDWVDKEGLSIQKVVQRLNEGALKPRKSQQWATSTVARMLHNETYAGLWYYNKNYSCEPYKRSIQSRYRPPKTSRRKRPREEWWRPVPLDSGLIIIRHEQWDRVQKQIATNAAVSPRNSKHFYLLKGLVKCGACFSSCAGGAGHSSFTYRCWKRCNQTPAINSDKLERIIWSAVEDVMLDPKVILPKATEISDKTRKHLQNCLNESQSLRRSIDQLQKEEDRVMLAYRTGVLTPTQLGDELQKLKNRKISLETRLRDIETGDSSKNQQQSPDEFCKVASSRMKSFTPEERQRFLNLILERIILNNDSVRIVGIIPVLSTSESYGSVSHPLSLQADSATSNATTKSNSIDFPKTQLSETNKDVIDSTSRYQSGISKPHEYAFFSNGPRGDGMQFELLRTVPRLRVQKKISTVSDQPLTRSVSMLV